MKTPYILIIYYTKNKAARLLAEQLALGIESGGHFTTMLRTVAPIGELTEDRIPQVPDSGPPFVTLEELKNAAGLAIGSPAYFGAMAAPIKQFLDTTSTLWMNASLIGKPATVFTVSESMHGGQESTLLSMMIPLLHHGMVIVSVPYSIPELNSTRSGGTPYGVSHVGLFGQNLTPEETRIAFAHGKHFASIAQKLNS